MTAFKDLLTALHSVGVALLHTLLILPLAGLKALDAGIQHLVAELSKV